MVVVLFLEILLQWLRVSLQHENSIKLDQNFVVNFFICRDWHHLEKIEHHQTISRIRHCQASSFNSDLIIFMGFL
jgi:hypothetical protein